MDDGYTPTDSEYTPDTDEIARAYCDWDRTTFDRWLAAHDRVVAAQAWDEGYAEGAAQYVGMDIETPIQQSSFNPYRTEESSRWE